MRVNDDTAIAQVLGIVSLKRYEREMCLLFVQFMKKEMPKESLRLGRHIRAYTSKMDYLFYGKAVPKWIALYPIVTLKGPALNIPDPCHEGYGHVLCMRFVSRGGWWSLQQELFRDTDINALPRYRRRAISEDAVELLVRSRSPSINPNGHNTCDEETYVSSTSSSCREYESSIEGDY
jgi:hypothetical protein